MTSHTYQFSKNFTEFPGGRHTKDGAHSGELFLETLLRLRDSEGVVLLDLSGVMGFATSFLDGAFGEYAAQKGGDDFYANFEIKCDDDPTLPGEIVECIGRADPSFKHADSQ